MHDEYRNDIVSDLAAHGLVSAAAIAELMADGGRWLGPRPKYAPRVSSRDHVDYCGQCGRSCPSAICCFGTMLEARRPWYRVCMSSCLGYLATDVLLAFAALHFDRVAALYLWDSVYAVLPRELAELIAESYLLLTLRG